MKRKENFYTVFLLPAIATASVILLIAAMATLFKTWQNNLIEKDLSKEIEITEVTTYDEGAKVVISVQGQEHLYWVNKAE